MFQEVLFQIVSLFCNDPVNLCYKLKNVVNFIPNTTFFQLSIAMLEMFAMLLANMAEFLGLQDTKLLIKIGVLIFFE